MSDIAIKVENLSKKYIIGSGTSGSLRETLSNTWRNTFGGKRTDEEVFWALQDINFEIKQGEAVGIIGRNGAGKSTLLKLLSKITYPTTGKINMNGRVSSLLEVGTGFHPELTGRENIYLNGTILGMSRKEVKSKFDEIVAFSGVEKFLDTPVKRYSSGMYVRLAFAVAAHLEPEILIIDEVLAVGDAEFQKKCLGKMDEVAKQGRTVIFVSHNMGAVKNLCTTGFLLKEGKLIYSDNIDNTVSRYYNQNPKKNEYTASKKSELFFEKVVPINKTNINTDYFNFTDSPRLEITINNKLEKDKLENCILGVVLLDELKNKIFTVEHQLSGFKNIISNNSSIILELPSNLIAPGSYSFLLAMHRPNVEILDYIEDVCYFQILDNEDVGHYKYNGVNQGSIIVEGKWLQE